MGALTKLKIFQIRISISSWATNDYLYLTWGAAEPFLPCFYSFIFYSSVVVCGATFLKGSSFFNHRPTASKCSHTQPRVELQQHFSSLLRLKGLGGQIRVGFNELYFSLGIWLLSLLTIIAFHSHLIRIIWLCDTNR